MVIKKPSAMIQTNAKGLTLTQRKTINALIHVAQRTGDRKFYTIPLKTLKAVCGITSVGNDDIKEQLRALTDVRIEYNYLEKDREAWEINVLLAGASIKKNTGIAVFAFSPLLQPKILDPSIYAPLNVLLISGFESSYTVILYEFLRDYLDSPKVPQLGITEFRELMGVHEGTHKLFKNLREWVIEVAAAEVNEKTDLLCRYELIKENGNKYTKIQWFVTRKKEPVIVDVPLLEHHNHLPAAILASLPEKHHTEPVFDILRPYCADPFDEAFVISNIRYALGKAKKNFPFYLSKALAEDFARATREGESQEKKIIDRTAEDRRRDQEAQEAFEREGEDRYMKLAVADLERLEAAVRREFREEGVADSFMLKSMIKGRVIEKLMGVAQQKNSRQVSLF